MSNILFTEDFLEERFSSFRGVVITLFAERFLKGTQDLLLLCVKVLGCFDVNGDDDVARSLGIIDVNDTLALECERLARLCSFGDGDLFLAATKGGNVYVCAERCFGKRDRNLTVKIVAFSCEEVVILNSDLDDEVAAGTAVSSCRALSAKHDVLIRVDTCGYVHLELFVYLNESLAVTVLTGGLYNFARSATA